MAPNGNVAYIPEEPGSLVFLDRAVPSLGQNFQRFEFFQETTARAEADITACIKRGDFSAGLKPAAALHVLWVGMLGTATIRLARRLAEVLRRPR